MTVWCLPSIDPVWREACLSTLDPRIRQRTLVIDNSVRNRGVAASWNLGIERARKTGSEWLILLSESMRFGPPGGRDFEEKLSEPWCDSLFGWHLIAWHMSVFDTVGVFDEVFWPAYGEDTDFLYRMGLADLPSPRENGRRGALVDVDATHCGYAHAVVTGLVHPHLTLQAERYKAKWGSDQGSEKFTHPYDDTRLDWRAVTVGPSRP